MVLKKFKKTWRKFSMPNALPIKTFLHSGQSGFSIFDLIMLMWKNYRMAGLVFTPAIGRGENKSKTNLVHFDSN